MQSISLEMYPGYTAVRDPRQKGGLPSGGGTKKAVTGFSKQSRLRLMKLIRSLSVSPDFHVTLSYPCFYPADSEVWKRHLDNFRRAVVRAFPEFWAIWKLEPQKRGAPHFHLMCSLGAEAREKMTKVGVYKILRAMWYEVVGSGYWNHFLKGAQVEDLRGDGQAKRAMYITSYVFKIENGEDLPGWARPGRFWGILNRGTFPPCEWQSVDLELDRAVWLKRLVKRWMKRQSRQYSRRLSWMNSFSVFCPPELIRKILFWILGPYQLEHWKSDQEYGDIYFYDPENGLCLDAAPF